MPVKFSSLETKQLKDTNKIIGLYNTEDEIHNCLINSNEVALKVDTENKLQTLSNNLNNEILTSVHKSNNESIDGVKTFTSSPIVPKPSLTDDSKKVPTTDWVNDVISAFFEKVYPIGSIYISLNESCPIPFGKWEKVSSGRVLQGADGSHNPGTTIEPGLPNITGEIYVGQQGNGYPDGSRDSTSIGTDTSYPRKTVKFSASNYNSLYGKSTTVQPSAYCVNIFKRIS